ncbi:MAG: tetratricopeptide repeat protein [Rhodospirillaceae bacterium]
MNFRLLAIPLLTGLAAFALAVFHNVEGVNIEALGVPAAMVAKTGYSSDIVIKRLADRMQSIERLAQSRASARDVMVQDDGGAAAILGDYFELTPMLRVVQTSFGLIPFTFSGEIVIRGKEMEMILRGRDNSGHDTLIRVQAPEDDLLGLIDKAAYEAVRVIDPTLLAAYQFKKDLLTRDFTRTEDVIRRGLAAGSQDSPKWLYNLWGITLFQQADRDGAIDKFRKALEIDPTFTSASLNWGVVLARQGRNQEAIAKFNDVVNNWRRGDTPDTLAAAFSEWGFSLALLGQTEAAIAKFRQATKTDPSFSDVYTSWAEVLSAAGRADEAQLMTARALQLAPEEKVYTDNLVGRIQTLPAVAASH